MPEDRKGQMRPADAIGDADQIAQIATSEVEEDIEDHGKYPAAKSLDKRGGQARAPGPGPRKSYNERTETSMLTPDEIESLREDGSRASAYAREVFRAYFSRKSN